MRIGYSYWGFLGDNKIEGDSHVSTPDGNATYSWSLLHEMQERGHQTFLMQKDRDFAGVARFGVANFASFSQQKRLAAWAAARQTYGANFPELDVLLLEWRFPIFGRNCQPNSNGGITFNGVLQPDLARQYELLKHYKNGKTKIILWDLDHKLDVASEKSWEPDAVFETAVRPRKLYKARTRVEPPILISDLLQFPTRHNDPSRKLVYVGSRYERDDVISEWVAPVAEKYPNEVEFWGKWDGADQLWPSIGYHGRITVKEFRDAYGTACMVPLLAKQSYLENGFITPRPWEALLFGSLPVGLGTHLGIEDYVHPEHIALDSEHLSEIVQAVASYDIDTKHMLRSELVHQLLFMDAAHFVDKIEDVSNGLVEPYEDYILEEGVA
jgi:hypothetical protein